MRWVKPIVVATSTVAQEFKQAMGQEALITVIKNGIDTQKFLPGCKMSARIRQSLPREKLLIGSGRLEEVKGHTFLIDAIASFNDHVHLVLAGEGEFAIVHATS